MPKKFTNTPECFSALQAAWQACSKDVWSLISTLECRYGAGNVSCATATERRMLNGLKNKQDKASDRLYKWLEQFSPRDWTSTASMAWVRDKLEYSDAITSNQMANIPQPSYGYSTKEAEYFAQAIQNKEQRQ